MPNFKHASKLKLRFKMPKGNVAVEDLWDLQIRDLENIFLEVDKAYTRQKDRFNVLNKPFPEKSQFMYKLQLAILREIMDDRNSGKSLVPDSPVEKKNKFL